jgi:D-alanyl-D-alanine carboxypeptidase (penicillin-binding protein 5/6)
MGRVKEFRLFVFLCAIVGVAFFAIQKGNGSSESEALPVPEASKQAEVASDPQGEVRGVSSEKITHLPLFFESRAAAAEFRPFMKEGMGRFYVPTAHAAVVMDADSGVVMYEDDAHTTRQIASLTKLMTAMIVVERVKDLDKELVTIDEEAVYAEGTRVGCPRSGYCNGQRLKVGEQLSVRDLLKAALMNSANDAAIALGKHIGGSQAGFAAIMNQRAKELGLKNTHFCTPSGLEIDGRESECYSSAYDIARIASQALKYDVLWEIMRLPEATIYSADGQYAHEIFNTDMLLGQYPNLLGTKTGFTPLAGYSLLAVAADPTGKHRVVSVVLNDPYRWEDIQRMFSWAFNTHVWR